MPTIQPPRDARPGHASDSAATHWISAGASIRSASETGRSSGSSARRARRACESAPASDSPASDCATSARTCHAAVSSVAGSRRRSPNASDTSAKRERSISASPRTSCSPAKRAIDGAIAGAGAWCRSVAWSASATADGPRSCPSTTTSRRKMRSPGRRSGEAPKRARSAASATGTVAPTSCASVSTCEHPRGPPISAESRFAHPASMVAPASACTRATGSRQLSPSDTAVGSNATFGCDAVIDSTRAVAGSTIASTRM